MQADLARQAQRLLLTTNGLLADPAGALLQSWPERGGVLYAAHKVSTKNVVGLTGAYMADTVREHTGYRPPVEDIIPDPSAYLDRVGGMHSFKNYVDTFPRRVGQLEAKGLSTGEAIGQERRALQGLAIGDPFRTWRKLTEDATTLGISPQWQGWVRIPEPGACAFCRMLASRGAVYKKNTGNFRSHNRCRCSARPAMDPAAAAAISADGEAAWAEMQATGDVPKIPSGIRRRGTFSQQRVDEINTKLETLTRSQRAAELRAKKRKELGQKDMTGESGRAGQRAKLIKEYRDERTTILNTTNGKPPRTTAGAKKAKDLHGVNLAKDLEKKLPAPAKPPAQVAHEAKIAKLKAETAAIKAERLKVQAATNELKKAAPAQKAVPAKKAATPVKKAAPTKTEAFQKKQAAHDAKIAKLKAELAATKAETAKVKAATKKLQKKASPVKKAPAKKAASKTQAFQKSFQQQAAAKDAAAKSWADNAAAAKARMDTALDATGHHPGMLNATEKAAVRRYTTNDHRVTNGRLRSGKTTPQAKHLDSAFESIAPTKAPLQVYRGIRGDTVDDIVANMRYRDKGYVSTSIHPNPAQGFAAQGSAAQRRAVLVIDVPKGAKVIDINRAASSNFSFEEEILLPRGSDFVVTRVTNEGGVLHLHATLVV